MELILFLVVVRRLVLGPGNHTQKCPRNQEHNCKVTISLYILKSTTVLYRAIDTEKKILLSSDVTLKLDGRIGCP